jgi:hypothetical protein
MNTSKPKGQNKRTTDKASKPEVEVEHVAPADERGPTGAVPEDNRPGTHPAHEQDKPDKAAFAAKFGIATDSETDKGSAAKAR